MDMDRACSAYECLVFSETLVHIASSLLFRTIQIEIVNRVESTDDAQEKQARSYELDFR
jgi:hypothetical protein